VLRPPSGGGAGGIHSFEGSSGNALQEKMETGISSRATPSMGRSPGDRPQATGAFFLRCYRLSVKGFKNVVKSQVFWTIPEQLLRVERVVLRELQEALRVGH
jgi:hypothetical protein